jgi:hypothetical protein
VIDHIGHRDEASSLAERMDASDTAGENPHAYDAPATGMDDRETADETPHVKDVSITEMDADDTVGETTRVDATSTSGMDASDTAGEILRVRRSVSDEDTRAEEGGGRNSSDHSEEGRDEEDATEWQRRARESLRSEERAKTGLNYWGMFTEFTAINIGGNLSNKMMGVLRQCSKEMRDMYDQEFERRYERHVLFAVICRAREDYDSSQEEDRDNEPDQDDRPFVVSDWIDNFDEWSYYEPIGLETDDMDDETTPVNPRSTATSSSYTQTDGPGIP